MQLSVEGELHDVAGWHRHPGGNLRTTAASSVPLNTTAQSCHTGVQAYTCTPTICPTTLAVACICRHQGLLCLACQHLRLAECGAGNIPGTASLCIGSGQTLSSCTCRCHGRLKVRFCTLLWHAEKLGQETSWFPVAFALLLCWLREITMLLQVLWPSQRALLQAAAGVPGAF